MKKLITFFRFILLEALAATAVYTLFAVPEMTWGLAAWFGLFLLSKAVCIVACLLIRALWMRWARKGEWFVLRLQRLCAE